MAKKEQNQKNSSNMIGKSAFLIGFILAIVAGAFDILDQMWTLVLALIGVLIGLLNVTERETQPFLLSGLVLIIVSAFGQGIFMATVPVVARILVALLVIFVPTTIIVAIRNVYNIAKD